jgi:hypothetical protein
VAPFIAGYASLVAVLGSSVRHLRQRNKNWCKRQEAQTRPDRRRDVLLIGPINQVTRCVSGVEHAQHWKSPSPCCGVDSGTVADDLEIGTWKRSAFKV